VVQFGDVRPQIPWLFRGLKTELYHHSIGHYLRDHPERRDDVAAVLTEKLE
jgi:hypothetical protein